MQLRFASTEVNAKKAKAKTSTKTSAPLKTDERLNIRNEIKIITADDTTFGLWSEVISSHSTGELIDPDTMKKFKDIKGWKPEKDGQLNRIFQVDEEPLISGPQEVSNALTQQIRREKGPRLSESDNEEDPFGVGELL